MKLMAEIKLSREDAVKLFTILEMSISLCEKLLTESGQLLGNLKPSDFVATVPSKSVNRLEKMKRSKSNKHCKICRKQGHTINECWNDQEWR